jgi:hypothetical protein
MASGSPTAMRKNTTKAVKPSHRHRPRSVTVGRKPLPVMVPVAAARLRRCDATSPIAAITRTNTPMTPTVP